MINSVSMKIQNKSQFILFFHSFAVPLHSETLLRLVAGTQILVYERKVRAAQDTPLPKIEAVGDSRIRQKRTTAPYRLE